MVAEIEMSSFDRVDTCLGLIIKLKSLIRLKSVIMFTVDDLLKGVV